MVGLAYLADPAGLHAMRETPEGRVVETKRLLLDTLFRFPSVRNRSLAPLLVGHLEDEDATEQVASDAEEADARFARARDWAALLLVRVLGLQPSFSTKPADWSKNGRRLTPAQIEEVRQLANSARP